MSTTTTNNSKSPLLYLVLLGLTLIVLAFLYYAFTYLSINVFLALDRSCSHLVGEGWLGYALLGLILGAAAGAVAAQRRFRLNKLIPVGAGIAIIGLCSFVLIQNTSQFAVPSSEAAVYSPDVKHVACKTCAMIVASSVRPVQNKNIYEAKNLLDEDAATAWISESAPGVLGLLAPLHTLQLKIAPLTGHQLIGLLIQNGYAKTEGTYQSFSRVKVCQLKSAAGKQMAWTLPDDKELEYFLPLEADPDSIYSLTLTVDATYSGENHPEVALSKLRPVFIPATK